MRLVADWVSCSADHSVGVEGSLTVTYYRCKLHGGESEGEVCVPFIGRRVATEAEAGRIPLEAVFCENQG
jgi:hypothetical protein